MLKNVFVHRVSGQWPGSGKSNSSNHAGKRLSSSHSQPGESEGPCVTV